VAGARRGDAQLAEEGEGERLAHLRGIERGVVQVERRQTREVLAVDEALKIKFEWSARRAGRDRIRTVALQPHAQVGDSRPIKFDLAPDVGVVGTSGTGAEAHIVTPRLRGLCLMRRSAGLQQFPSLSRDAQVDCMNARGIKNFFR